MRVHIVQLRVQQLEEILDMQNIPHLLPGPTESDIGQGASEMVSRNPQHGHPLVDLAHLPGTGKNAAAIHDGPEVIGRDIFVDEQFRAELGCPVQRSGPDQGKVLRDALQGDTRASPIQVPLEPCRRFPTGQRVQRLIGIHPAGRQEHQLRLMPPGQFQTVDGADQIGVHDICRVPIETGKSRWLRRTLDDRIHPADRIQVGAVANVSMAEMNAVTTKAFQVQLRPAPFQIIERDNVPIRVGLTKQQREIGSHKSRAARDEQSLTHGLPPNPSQCERRGRSFRRHHRRQQLLNRDPLQDL